MKNFKFFLLVFFLFPHFLFSDISDFISKSELMFYFPNYHQASWIARDLIKKFYGKNFKQMLAQISLESESGYQVDILDPTSLRSIGINPDGPLAYVHVNDQQGYLLLSLSSRKKFKSYVKRVLGNALPYRFEGDFVLLSETESHLDAVTNRLASTEAFTLAAKKLDFHWRQAFFWMESAYLGKLSSSAGISQKVKVPYGFSAMTLSARSDTYRIRLYSALLSDRQVRFMRLMKQASGKGKFEFFDYIGGNPALMMQVYLNLSLAYRYYRFIDRIGVLGLTEWIDSLKKNYQVYVERDLIHNADGRFKLLVEKWDSKKGQIKLCGSIGIRNPLVTKALIDSLASAVLKKEDKLYSFELFTHPFYHYQGEKISLYYGLVENDFVFASDKEQLKTLLTHIYSKQGGFLKSYPDFFRQAVESGEKGVFVSFDVQSILSGINFSGLDVSSDFLVGIRDISVQTKPDQGKDAYGWNTQVDLNFYPSP